MATGDLGRENLRRALDGFAQALAIDVAPYPDFVRDCIDSGRIQKFEYCVELFWKHLRSRLMDEGLDVPNSPRGAIKAGFERGVIGESDYQPTLDLIVDRNTCSQVYRQSLIPGVVARLLQHCATMQRICERLGRG